MSSDDRFVTEWQVQGTVAEVVEIRSAGSRRYPAPPGTAGFLR